MVSDVCGISWNNELIQSWIQAEWKPRWILHGHLHVEWMNERTNEWTNERANERTNERTNEWMNALSVCTRARLSCD